RPRWESSSAFGPLPNAAVHPRRASAASEDPAARTRAWRVAWNGLLDITCLANDTCKNEAKAYENDHGKETHWTEPPLHVSAAPSVWGLRSPLAPRMAAGWPFARGVTRAAARRPAALLDSLRPDALVTVHATPATAMSALVAEGRRTPPHTSVVTDFVAHSQW